MLKFCENIDSPSDILYDLVREVILMNRKACIAMHAGVPLDQVEEVLHSKRKSPETNVTTLKILQAADTFKPISSE